MSYALDSTSDSTAQRVTDYNHFVVFDPHNILACQGYQYIDLEPDYSHVSCHAAYNSTDTASFVTRTGQWHHLAVTFNADDRGRTLVYRDGLLMAEAVTDHVDDLQAGGAFMLGGEQDCYGGCTSAKQAFYGLMDEVRLWNVVRSQSDIVRTMRLASGVEQEEGLVGLWKFDEPATEAGADHKLAKDMSGNGNDLALTHTFFESSNEGVPGSGAPSLNFANSFLINPDLAEMPEKSFSVEMWAKTPEITAARKEAASTSMPAGYMFSYGSFLRSEAGAGVGQADWAFVDDAISIAKYTTRDLTRSRLFPDEQTEGSISVRVNANHEGMGSSNDHWLDFATNWTDDSWHHIAVTWDYDTGATTLYFDGAAATPFWRSEAGMISDRPSFLDAVDNKIATNKLIRAPSGSLVVGQKQDCYGGCFNADKAFDGSLAELRVWSRVLSADEVAQNMNKLVKNDDVNIADLKHAFSMGDLDDGLIDDVLRSGNLKAGLKIGYNAPTYLPSGAPLSEADGLPVATPDSEEYALFLHDTQVLMLPEFKDFPTSAITVEFWMLSTDSCRKGAPFSYAAGAYEGLDNAFLIFNYQDWGIAVMEDEGKVIDHGAGFGSTDGMWHYIAVTWESSSGLAKLYDNARLMWTVKRGQGVEIVSGGTLVVGREQDCRGGCFDSTPGAVGRAGNTNISQEYGAQDFTGVIDQLRIWDRALSAEEITGNFVADSNRLTLNTVGMGDPADAVDPSSSGLIAFWKFDEGEGYQARDATGHGHTLQILEDPQWVSAEVVFACGDGKIQGWESCDDGNQQDGDGCSSQCDVEAGWHCTASSPSICSRGDIGITGSGISETVRPDDSRPSWIGRTPSRPAATPAPSTSASGKGGGKGSKVSTAWIIILVACVLTVVSVLVFARAPIKAVAGAVHRVAAARFARSPPDYDPLTSDNEFAYVASPRRSAAMSSAPGMRETASP